MVRVVSASTAALLGLGLAWTIETPVLAQIIPDNSLGEARSHLTTNAQIKGELADRIDGGVARNTVLFHSFSEFNIGDSQRVYFANPTGIESIFSRVTGSDVSAIMGTLGVDGGADLFLLNPNGIIFGENARLDIAGSFMATTADSFDFGDGQIFSAVDPGAPPLLTVNVRPGLQWGEGQSEGITNVGHLSVDDSLTLVGDRLHLSGTLEAGRNLNMRSPHSIQIRDTTTKPFIATAGNHLRLRGESIDIFALNHPDSGLTAGGNLLLRSDRPVIGDAHFHAGQEFRVERSSGRLGRLISETDPVIRSDGDVSFRNYEGASLHILAGGSVTIPGTITITGADTLDNALQESVTLSDGETVVEIDGSAEPTLDVRAGLRPRLRSAAARSATARSVSEVERGANITLGNISNPGGTIFLTNQYQPNMTLDGGDIRIGAIDTSVEQFTAGTARGGDVVIDVRGDIEITGDVTTVARVGTFNVEFADIERDGLNPIIEFAGNNARAVGGNITLLSDNNITTQNLNAFAVAAAEGVETQILQADGTEIVQRGDAQAVAEGGHIVVATQVDRTGQTVRTAIGNIETADIDTSARAVVDTSVDASGIADGAVGKLPPNTNDAGVAIAGNASTRVIGGTIALSTDIGTGEIRTASDIGTIRAQHIIANAHAFSSSSVGPFARAFLTTDARGGGKIATSGTIETLRNQGGAIALSTDIQTGEIRSVSDIGTISIQDINASALFEASAYASAENSADEVIATSGGIGTIRSQGGAIHLSTRVQTGDITTASDIGNLRVQNIDAYVYGVDPVRASASAYTGEISGSRSIATRGTIGNIQRQGGTLTLNTNVQTGEIATASNIGTITTQTIAASIGSGSYDVEAVAVAGVRGDSGGTATSRTIDTIQSQGGAITLRTNVLTRDVTTASNIGTLSTQSISAGMYSLGVSAYASARAYADGIRKGIGESTTQGTVGTISSQGGEINLETNVQTGDITTASDIGTLRTQGISASIGPRREIRTTRDTVGTILSQGGGITLETNVQTGDITTASDIGTLNTQGIFALADTRASTLVNNANNRGGNATRSMVSTIRSQGGGISVSSNVRSGDISTASDISTLRIQSINSSTDAFAFVFADATSNLEEGGEAKGGPLESVSSQGGEITLTTTAEIERIASAATIGTIQTEQIDTSANAFVDVSASATEEKQGADGQTIGGNTIAIAIADAGNITLSTDIRSGSIVQASDWGTIQHTPMQNYGNYSNPSINASARALADTTVEGDDTQSQPGNARFEANGGAITVEAMGQIQFGSNAELNASAGVFSQVVDSFEPIIENADLKGGNITLVANDNILLNQVSAETNSVFIINGEPVETNLAGSSAGTLTICTPGIIRLRDDAEASVSATGGKGIAGDIESSSDSLILGERSSIFSRTDSGDGGNITINTASNPGEILLLLPESSISTSAGTEQQGGNGGDITINSRFITTLDQYNSDITANAFTGSGGNITITTDGLFGLEFRDQATNQSDITASSEAGLDGTFTLNTPDVDPTQGAIALPTTPNDLPPINPICVAARSGSSFTLVGRGGIPPVPTDLSNEMDPWEDWYIATPDDTHVAEISGNSSDDSPVTENIRETQIIEAQGWAIAPDGTAQLIAQTQTATPTAGTLQSPNCHYAQDDGTH